MDRAKAKEQRRNDPIGRDRYLEKCRDDSGILYRTLGSKWNDLSEEDRLSIAETAEYLEDESIGIEGVDY